MSTDSTISKPDRDRGGVPAFSMIVLVALTGAAIYYGGISELSQQSALLMLVSGSLVLTYHLRILRQSFDNSVTTALYGISYMFTLASSLVFCIWWATGVIARRPGMWESILRWEAPTAYSNAGWLVSVFFFALVSVMLIVVALAGTYRDSFGRARNDTSAD